MIAKRQIAFIFMVVLSVLIMASCFDVVTHEYDCQIDQDNSPSGDGGEDLGTTDSEDTDSIRTSPSDDDGTDEPGQGQGIRPAGWEEFGKACETHEDCSGIPGGGKCINSIMQLIFAPKGYCIMCCDDPGIDKCGPGFDCVGVQSEALTFLVCINNCEKDEDCRQEDGYECKPVPYLDEYYPDKKYCMPIILEAPSDDVQEMDPECNWSAP